MADYISRDAVLQEIQGYADFRAPDYLKGWANKLKAAICADLFSAVDCIPTADVRENRWISVKERLPKDLQTVLVRQKDGMMYLWMFCAQSPTDEMWVDEYANAFSVYETTHWMPLPEPPKEET